MCLTSQQHSFLSQAQTKQLLTCALTLLHCYIAGAGVYHYNANNRLLWPAKESMLLYPLVAIAEVGKIDYNADDAVMSTAEGGTLIYGCRSLPGR